MQTISRSLRSKGNLPGRMGERAKRATAAKRPRKADEDFLSSLMDTSLYSMGAFFCDEHPDLVDEIIEQSAAIEVRGLREYAADQGMTIEECFETLLTGLAVRYYKALAA